MMTLAVVYLGRWKEREREKEKVGPQTQTVAIWPHSVSGSKNTELQPTLEFHSCKCKTNLYKIN
jgi:hypothetical protein